MALPKKTLPSLRFILPFCKSHVLNGEMKPKMIFHKFNFRTYSCDVYPFHSYTRSCQQMHSKYSHSIYPTNQISKFLCGAKVLSFNTSFTLHPEFSNCKRYYHARSRLSVEDSVFLLYLQSLVEELKVIEEGQSQSNQTFGTDKEERIHIARHQFLIGANEVISKILDKQSEISELKSMSAAEQDSDMKEMIQHEMQTLGKQIQLLEDELIDVLAGDEPADNNDIILQVSAGVGGQEAMLFCAEVFNMYCQYGLGKGWNVMQVEKDENELGGFRKASIEIGGLDVYRWLKYEAGVHRVQRVPKTEKGGRVHTSTVSVSVLPQPREIDIQIEKKDLKIETFRNSGPGGQSVNTTDSAVRVTHLPTGTVAECRQERSQLKNRDKAMKILKMRLYQAQLEEEEANRRATRKMQVGSRGRSEKIRTYNYQQDRVSDHRVKENYSNLPDFMAGGEGLDDLITHLEKDFKNKIVESMVDEYELSLKKTGNKNS